MQIPVESKIDLKSTENSYCRLQITYTGIIRAEYAELSNTFDMKEEENVLSLRLVMLTNG